VIITIWETEDQMNAGFDTAMLGLRTAIERGGLEMIDVTSGPVHEWQ
jgi:hypothetical protein